MRDSQYRRLLVILARGTVRSETECRLLDTFVANTTETDQSLPERAEAERLLAAYRRKPDDSA